MKNILSLWAVVTGTVGAVVYMFTNFVSADEFRDYQKDGWYTAYYLLMDKKPNIQSNTRTGEENAEDIEQNRERVEAAFAALLGRQPE
jgi:hypothetical protein